MTAKFTRKDLDKMVEDVLKPPGKVMPGGDIKQRGKSAFQKLLGKKPKLNER